LTLTITACRDLRLIAITITAHSVLIEAESPNLRLACEDLGVGMMPAFSDRIARRHARIAPLMIAVAAVTGCSSMGDNPVTIFADPGKYQFYNCEQLAGQRRHWSTREQELRLLMDKAEQGAGGALVNLFAYKADHVAAREELAVIDSAARARNCDNSAGPAGSPTLR
jgi:hypothetical protein